MLHLKNINLTNYGGYQKANFNFKDSNDNLKKMSVFYGPNGIGKSTIISAINLVCNASAYRGKNNDLLFRKNIFHTNYNPTYGGFTLSKDPMRVEAVFESDLGEKKVIIDSSFVNKNNINDGIEKNELEEIPGNIFNKVVFTNADSPINMQQFQISLSEKDMFKDIAEAIYGYPVLFDDNIVYSSGPQGKEEEYEEIGYIQNFILQKGSVKVHFKRMSDGEKKIATLLRFLSDPTNINRSDIILIDNIEMHVYFKRHPLMVDKLLNIFPNKQFIVTTHSGTLIEHIRENYSDSWLFDLEKYSEKN